jgi:hypothetical protein
MGKLDFILKLKTYEVFLLILVGGILKKIEFDDNMINALLSSTGFILYAGWPFFVGHALHQRYPDLIRWNYQVFTLCSGIWALTILAVPIISAVLGLAYIEVLTVPGAIVVFLAVGYCLLYTAKLIESADIRKEVDGFESDGVLLLILLLPIGIWFLQPIVNKMVADKPEERAV